MIVVFQSWPSYGDFKNLVDCWVAFADCASFKTPCWKQMFCLGKNAQDHLGRALSVKQQQTKIDRWFETATCQPKREKYNFALVHTRNLLPDGSTPVISNLTHFVSARRVGQLKEIPDTFAPPPVLAGADGIQTMVQYEQAREEGTLRIVPSASSISVPVGVLVDDEEQDVDCNSNPSLAGVGSASWQARTLREQHNTKDRLRLLIRKYIQQDMGATTRERALKVLDFADAPGRQGKLVAPFNVAGATKSLFSAVLAKTHRSKYNKKQHWYKYLRLSTQQEVAQFDAEAEEEEEEEEGEEVDEEESGAGEGGGDGGGGFVRVESAEDGDSYRQGKSLMCVLCAFVLN